MISAAEPRTLAGSRKSRGFFGCRAIEVEGDRV